MAQAANIAEVAELRPDYMGFIFYGQSPRAISEVSAELIRYVPEAILTIGVFVDEDLDQVKARIIRHQLKAIQLHGKESAAYCGLLKDAGITVIKAFGVGQDFDFGQLEPYADVVDYFLFDTQTPAHGGSGRVFDWKLLDDYQLDKPYFLSGGIDLQHVEAIKSMTDSRLHAIDVNSRFEIAPGLKDVNKVNELIQKFKIQST